MGAKGIRMYVTVNGARLYFDVEGSALVPDGPKMREKPTLILVHGGPGADHSHYKPAYSQLSDIAQIIYYDHRGNGRSDMCSCETWTLDQWADDLRGLADALGIEKPIVSGTSFGGFVAQAYATKFPEHPSKLILISTAAKVDFQKIFRMFGKLGGPEAEAIAEEYWTNPTSETRMKFRDICVPLYQVRKEDTADWLSRVRAKDDTALWFNGPKNEHGRMDYRQDLGRITCPTLVMAGELDPITPIEFSEEIVQGLSPELVTFKRFDNCGHGVVGDQPEAAFQAIRNFILEQN